MSNLSCANLALLGRDIPTPFHMTLVDDLLQEDVRIDRVLRIIPGKRLVALASWRETRVILKLFFDRRAWKRHFQNDIEGVAILREKKILTPRILHRTTTLDDNGGVLIFSYLQQGVNLGDLFERAKSDEEREHVCRLAMDAMASCHTVGLWQADIHLNNFMVSEGRVYVLDGADIRSTRTEIGRKDILVNLALFFAQFPATMDSAIPRLIAHYNSFTAPLSEEEQSYLPTRVITARTKRLDKYEKKLFRSTTAHRSIRESNRRVMYDRSFESPELEDFILDPDSFIASGQILKAGNSSTVAVITLGNREFVVKRYNIKGFWHAIKRAIQPSRAHYSWRNAAILEMLGIATPHPCLFMELRLYSLRKSAYLLCERVLGDDILSQVEAGNKSAFESDKLVEAFDSLLRVFNDYKISHGDMKASNFIYRNDQLYVLDLDAMKRYRGRLLFNRAHRKDRDRLVKNWKDTWMEQAFQSIESNPEAESAG